MKLINIIYLFIFFSMIACSSPKQPVDLIVHNAVVYTVDETFTIQQAFAVHDGRYVAIGTNNAILGNFESEQVLDLEGQAVFPGFSDAHCHFYGYGTNLIKRADLVGTKSFEEVVERLKEHYEKHPTEWIEGRGWDQNDWAIKEFPVNELLNNAFPNIPVYLIRIDGHAAIANNEALKQSGITSDTKINGGEVILKNGIPTGVLIDNAMEFVSDIIPVPDDSFNHKALMMAQEKCFAVGLTSVTDAGLDKDIVQLIDKMQKEGDLKMRVNAMLSPTKENVEFFIKNGPYVTDQLTVRSIKLYADGALGSRGAKMIEPYSDDLGNVGLFMHEKEYYQKYCQLAFDNGYQVNTHAIGDEGNRFILETYADFLQGTNDRRWRIEHSQIVHPDDFKLFGQFSIIPSVQPTHATSDMYWAEDRVGHERIKGAYAYKQLLNENGWMPLGTDFPIEDIDPLKTFYAAIARQDAEGWPEEGFQMENALTREEALKGMTIWAAKAAFEEDKKGSIESGKVADFVVLGGDIMQLNTDLIPSLEVVSTFCDGIEVFGNEE